MPEVGEIRKGKEIGRKTSNKFIWFACIDCGKERWVLVRQGKPGYLCCWRCSRVKEVGEKSSNWRGGRVRTGEGYIEVRLPKDNFFYSMANHQGYVMEHRLVMAKHLSRCLLPWEIVHHRNSIKDDNKLENLELLPTSKYHLVDTVSKSLIGTLQREVLALKQRITVLEAENILLKEQIKVIITPLVEELSDQ